MGHRHSSAQLGWHGGIRAADRRTAESPPPRATALDTQKVARLARSFGTWFSLAFVRFYQIFLGPFFGGACKFYPSCSHYAYEAVERHGARRGLVLAMKRLGRCRPFTQGGFDPVPDRDEIDPSLTKQRDTERAL
jgi:uncharacterized protein